MSSSDKNCHEGHRERLKERYRTNGLDGFSDHEILELLLGYCLAQKDTNPIGHALVDRFGNLQGVFEASEANLQELEDIGPHSSFLLKLIPDICRRYFTQLQDGSLKLIERADPVEFFIPRFIGLKTECLYAAFLDENRNLIECTLQYQGSINAVEIHSGKIVKQALRCGGKYVVIAHNHFTDSIPSKQDIDASKHLYYELLKYSIHLLDHVIVCGKEGTSMLQSGHFNKVK